MAKHFPKDFDPSEMWDDVEEYDDSIVSPVESRFELPIERRSEPPMEEPVVVPMWQYKEPKGIPVWLDLLLTALITIAVVVVMRLFVADTYEVPTGSMLETIQLNDRLVGEKISYRFRTPKTGEVVTFDDPGDPGVTLIKRVVATEGQTVELVDGNVVVDGVVLDEPYVLGKPSEPIDRYLPSLEGTITYPYVVPEGHVWVMGDNRTNSLDSRYFGAVPVSSVSSHAIFIFWPFSDAGTL